MDIGKILRRVVASAIIGRFSYRVAKEFATQEAMDEYLKEHPDADKSNHWVKTDTEGYSKAVEHQKQNIDDSKKESEGNWKRDEKKVLEHVSGVGEHVSEIMNTVPALNPDMRTSVQRLSKEGEAALSAEDKEKRKKARQQIVQEVRSSLQGKEVVGKISERYGIKPKDVMASIESFVSYGGGKDTQVDLEISLKNKARAAYQADVVSKFRPTSIIPKELLTFIPANLGFHIDNKRNVKLKEHYGNKEKTMVAKIQEQQLLLIEKKKIMKKVSDGLKSEDEKTRMLSLITGIGMNTGIRTGGEGNHITVKNGVTGEETEEDTYGVTTLLAGHVQKLKEGSSRLEFKGKKGTINIYDLDDKEIVNHLSEMTKDKAADQPIFVTKDGKKIDDEEVNKFVKEFGITYTDFRKFRGTTEVFEGLKKDMEGMYREIAEQEEKSRQKTKEKVVKVLYEHLKKVFEEARKKLNHKDVSETIDSYVNPMVVLNMISTGKIGEEMDEAIENNGRINFNIDAILKEAQKHKTGAS